MSFEDSHNLTAFLDSLEQEDSEGDFNLSDDDIILDGGVSNDNTVFAERFEFVVHGVLICAIGCLGLIGNSISVVILSRPQMKSSINCILIGALN